MNINEWLPSKSEREETRKAIYQFVTGIATATMLLVPHICTN